MLGADRTPVVVRAGLIEPLGEVAEESVAFVREELAELRQAGLLGPFELQWAIDHLIGSGVGLPEVLSVVFDFAELGWLRELTSRIATTTQDEELVALAKQLGLDPVSGKRLQSAPAPRRWRDQGTPNVELSRCDASRVGSEGVRQKPLRGWHGE